MIFKRREKPPFWRRFREILYPRKGWWRPFDYARKRVRRLPDSPGNIALGLACGTMASFTPFFGFHFIIAAAFAWAVGGNVVSSLLGTLVGNPITFPVIAGSALNLGWWMLGQEGLDETNGLSFSWLVDNVEKIFLPYLVGGFVPGLVTAAIIYFVSKPIVATYQRRRRERLHRMAEERRQTRKAAVEAEAENA